MIPSDLLLASLKLAHPEPPLTTRLGSLKRFLVKSPNLTTFHYQDRGQGTNFSLSGSERLPAFTDLSLKSYNWDHSMKRVSKHWDFSRIKSLELISVPMHNFLESIVFEDFAGLRNLHVDDYSSHLRDQRHEATAYLYLMIRNFIIALEVLDIVCHTRLFLPDAILMHRGSLRVLRMRDHTGFEDENKQCPTLWALDVKLLAKHMTLVHTLEIDMDSKQCVPTEFLRAVCGFKSLHTLTLHVQTVLNPRDEVNRSVDLDYEAALQTLSFLVQVKQETAADAPASHVPWNRITINVGGWKRVMVRRIGCEWQRHHENGVFAERCFVMERSGDATFEVKEELCAVDTSRTE